MTSSAAGSRVNTSLRASVAVIELNRPSVLNACDADMHSALIDAIAGLAGRADVKAGVISGAGRSFCAGADISVTRELRGHDIMDYVGLDFEAKNAVAGAPFVTVAAVHGYAAGGGFELALACDLRICSEDARFFFGEIGLGTVPGAGGLERLRDVVGAGIAMEWVLSGREISAEEALSRGLVNRVVHEGSVVNAAVEWAEELASRERLALSIARAGIRPNPRLGEFDKWFHRLASMVCHEQEGVWQRKGIREKGGEHDVG